MANAQMNDLDCGVQASQIPKNQILNPKQVQMLPTQMTKTKTMKATFASKLPLEFCV
jgi:hypothetical protein